jgi:hypothetical protein
MAEKYALFQALAPQAKATAIPVQHLYLCRLAIDEDKQLAAGWFLLEQMPNHSLQAIIRVCACQWADHRDEREDVARGKTSATHQVQDDAAAQLQTNIQPASRRWGEGAQIDKFGRIMPGFW